MIFVKRSRGKCNTRQKIAKKTQYLSKDCKKHDLHERILEEAKIS